jgi:pimeloyl-ACP methyl ester carboxylesterase
MKPLERLSHRARFRTGVIVLGAVFCLALPSPPALRTSLTYFNEVDKGGHFAAWEGPDLFASELRAAFRSLRSVN